MGILKTIENCIRLIPAELIENHVIYVELDKENYELIQIEITSYSLEATAKFTSEKVPDMGKCITLVFNGYKIVVVLNSAKTKLDDFYFTFKTKII